MSDRPGPATHGPRAGCRRATTTLPYALLSLLAACSTFTEEAHRKIAHSMGCPKAQVTITEDGEHIYVAHGCGYRGTYVCRHKVHPRASGARYVVCELQRNAQR